MPFSGSAELDLPQWSLPQVHSNGAKSGNSRRSLPSTGHSKLSLAFHWMKPGIQGLLTPSRLPPASLITCQWPPGELEGSVSPSTLGGEHVRLRGKRKVTCADVSHPDHGAPLPGSSSSGDHASPPGQKDPAPTPPATDRPVFGRHRLPGSQLCLTASPTTLTLRTALNCVPKWMPLAPVTRLP